MQGKDQHDLTQGKVSEDEQLNVMEIDTSASGQVPDWPPAILQMIIPDLEGIYDASRDEGGIWSKYRLCTYNSQGDMQQGQSVGFYHDYGPVKSDINNKQLRYAFCAAGISLTDTIMTKVLRAVRMEWEREKVYTAFDPLFKICTSNADLNGVRRLYTALGNLSMERKKINELFLQFKNAFSSTLAKRRFDALLHSLTQAQSAQLSDSEANALVHSLEFLDLLIVEQMSEDLPRLVQSTFDVMTLVDKVQDYFKTDDKRSVETCVNKCRAALKKVVTREVQDAFKATLLALSTNGPERNKALNALKMANVAVATQEGYLETAIRALGGSLFADVDSELEGREVILVQDMGKSMPLVEVLKAFWLSAGDSEVALLTDLYACFWNDQTLVNLLKARREQQQPCYIRMLICGNMGPCIRCQARIEAFLQDLQAYAQRWQCQIELQLDLCYSTEYNAINREPYGYDPVKYPVQKHTVQTQHGSWPYWSVSFTKFLL